VIQRLPLPRTLIAPLLAVTPYLLLLATVLLTQMAFWVDGAFANQVWSVLRWTVRLLLVGGAYLGWRLTNDQLRPRWWYSWLGFATYELVGLLLLGAIALMSSMTQMLPFLAPAGLLLGALAFLPYIVVAIIVAHQEQRLAFFTVFPHAALTAPLFFLAMGRALAPELDPTMLWATVLPLLVTMLFVGWWSGRQEQVGYPGLSGGIAAGQGTFALSMAWGIGEPWAILVAIPLIILGAFILIGPLLLLPLWHFGLQIIRRLGGDKGLDWLQTGERALLTRLAASPSANQPTTTAAAQETVVSSSSTRSFGGSVMTEITTTPPATNPLPTPGVGPGLERLYKLATVILAAVIIAGVLIFVGRSAIYKIHEFERGLHLRGGRFLAVQQPGWHMQIPLVDTVIIVKINERLGYVERIEAMTSDNVTMFVSLQYTYRVTDPQQYTLAVDDPERIVFEFVQGRLRDVVNTKAMATVMNDRAMMNEEVMAALREKESQYGVQFATVQLQSASPPDEVLTAIKDRMVAAQRQEQAQAEAAQQKTVADAEFYTAQKRAEAAAYEITKTAEAEAERIRLNTEVQQLAIRSIVGELEGKGELANKFIDYLIAQELKNNSKWIINGEGTPIVDLQ
jgi:regulator of protease activity HflC (stomatin/prohibitin superfamily)